VAIVRTVTRHVRRLTRAAGSVLGPVDYSARSRYRRPPELYRRLQPLGWLLTRVGLSPAGVVTLDVPGRRTGRRRRTNLLCIDHDGRSYLVALAGESEWVRNVRGAGGRARLSRAGRRRTVTLVEVPVTERPAVLRAYLHRWGRPPDSPAAAREGRSFFGVDPGAPDAELVDVAAHYPVFRVVEDDGPA
jgi:deazaflavin-dependent oxidoreductase (nitroreductase family)